jgi:hypothetical protein
VIRVALLEGTRGGATLSACVIVLAVAGLTIALRWELEVALVALAILVPLLVLGLTGHRAGRRSRQTLGGLVAGAVAGGIGGVVGGLAYVWFGKPLLNVVVGLALGTLGGAVLGALGAQLAIRRQK